MTPADSFANDNTLRRRVGSLAPVSRFTFCRRSSRLPYRAVVCLPLSPRPCRRLAGKSSFQQRNGFDLLYASSSFSSPSSSSSSWCRVRVLCVSIRQNIVVKSNRRKQMFLFRNVSRLFLFFFFLYEIFFLDSRRAL